MQTDLSQTIEWNLVARFERGATPNPNRKSGFDPLPSFSSESDSPIVSVGISSPTAPPHWWFGGRVFLSAPLSPSSTSNFYFTDLGSQICPLNRLTLLQLPEYLPKPYVIRFDPARWLTSIRIEIWKYDNYQVEQMFRLVSG